MSETVKLRASAVIGTGDPFDCIMLVPLICDWGIPNQCVFCWNEGKDKKQSGTITRILVLDEAFAGHKHVGCCEAHFGSHVHQVSRAPEGSVVL